MEATQLMYQCPCCGGKIEFDSKLQQMKCPFCDTTFDVATLRDYDEVLKQQGKQETPNWSQQEEQAWTGEENMAVFTCQTCGGELVIREDDKPETVRHRLSVYHAETEALKGFYEKLGKLRLVEGNQPIEDASRDILAALGDSV